MSTPFKHDFFISRRGTVAAVAQEVSDILVGEGFRVTVQDYDFAASGQFVHDIDHALMRSRNLLILYSHDYHSSFWTQQEFHNFLAEVSVSNGERRIGVLRCDSSIPAGLLRSATYGDLADVTDPAERRRIILAVANGQAPAARPTPRVFGGSMPLRNRLFTGREDLLTAMHAALSVDDSAAALTQAAMHGLGGVGKTSLAREYVARHGGDYSGGVWWVTAADRPGVLAGLSALAHALDPRLPDDTPVEAAAHAALDALAKRQTRFLLIYDNAPGPHALTGLLPARGANVLITSRHPGWDRQAAPLRVEAMAEDDAANLLQRLAGRQDDAGARRLARELGYLPLALDQAGAYARETLTSFDDYTGQVEALIRRAGGNPDYPASVAATFDLAIDEAVRRAPAAEDMLGRFAWFAPESIPLLLLDPEMAGRAEALAALGNLSLVMPATETGTGPAVSVHRLVQAVMRQRLAEKGVAEASRDRALNRMAAAFPYVFRNATIWPFCHALLPHVRSLVGHFPKDHSIPELSRLLNRTGTYLHGHGDAAGAVPLFRRALKSRERSFGTEHPYTLTSVNNLAGCLEALGDAAQARKLYRRALEGIERRFGPDHPSTKTIRGTYERVAREMGRQGGTTIRQWWRRMRR